MRVADFQDVGNIQTPGRLIDKCTVPIDDHQVGFTVAEAMLRDFLALVLGKRLIFHLSKEKSREFDTILNLFGSWITVDALDENDRIALALIPKVCALYRRS